MRWLRRYWRDVCSTLVELVGIGLLVTAAWTFAPLAGLVALGVALIVVGYAINAR